MVGLGYVGILAGRRVNDAMGNYVAERTATLIGAARGSVEHANVLVLGFAFKENVADVRNSRVADIVHALRARGARCSIFVARPQFSGAWRA